MTNLGNLSPFCRSKGRCRTLVDSSLESPCQVLVKSNWTCFSISYSWGATRQNVSKLAAFRRGGSLWVKISGGRGRSPANTLIPLERQLIALQLCRWQFLYNETFSRFLVLYCWNLYKRLGIWSPFWGSYGQCRTLVDGSLESPYTTCYSP